MPREPDRERCKLREPRQPVRPGTPLYRLLERIAAEVARELRKPPPKRAKA
jgi:hypothetical protein